MNNTDVQLFLADCDSELTHIDSLITTLGGTNLMVPYLNKYSVIRACGAIEIAFKTLIADHCSRRSKQQVKNFLNRKIRENSANPSYQKIMEILSDFDSNWKANFKSQMRALSNYSTIKDSLQSLVDARNEFAHGGNPTITFSDVKIYYSDAKVLITTLDNVIG